MLCPPTVFGVSNNDLFVHVIHVMRIIINTSKKKKNIITAFCELDGTLQLCCDNQLFKRLGD